MKKSRLSNGFTLIELLVVVLIIAILAAIAIPQYETAVERSRMTEAVTNVKAVYRADEMYKLVTGNHTTDFNLLDVSIAQNPSKYFQYGLNSDEFVATTHNPFAFAWRMPDNNYWIGIMENRKISCWANTSKATKIQQKICSQINQNGSI